MRTTMSNKTNQTPALIAVALLLGSGCGGPKPAPQTAKDLKADKQAPVKVAPKRQISGEAQTAFEDALKKYRALGSITKANCSDAASAFADVYDSFPKVVESKFNEGVVWEKCGEDAKAEKIYQEILQRHANHGPTLNNLGHMLFRKGQSGAAMSYFQRAAAAKNSEGYANLAMLQRDRALAGNGDALREAINNIHRALAMDSFNIEAYNLLATILYDHARTPSQLEMARLIAVQATKVQADYAPIYNVLGLILLKAGKVTPALAEFKKAVERDPKFVDALMNIGATTLSFRDYSTAERSFRTVLSQSPRKEIKYAATVGLGVALRGQRKFDQALVQYKAAESIEPGNSDIAYNMGILQQDYTFDAADPAKAIAQLQKAVNELNRYVSGARDRSQISDAQRRVKNINEMIPMLREQQKMMQAPQK